MTGALNLSTHDVTVSLAGRPVLRDVSVSVRPGRVTALVGPNGAGKSSLLRVLAGDLHPDSGDALLNGRPLAAVDVTEQALARAVMSQSTSIAFDFRVDDILRMGWVRGGGGESTALRNRLEAIAVDCDIEHLLERSFNTLSGGERQRVQFARALLQLRGDDDGLPRYLLLDEPTASLDLGHELTVLGLSRQAAAGGIGVLVVLHDLNLAGRFADEIVLMHGGAVIASGPPAAVLEADRLTHTYATPVRVDYHEQLDRLVIHT